MAFHSSGCELPEHIEKKNLKVSDDATGQINDKVFDAVPLLAPPAKVDV